MTESPHARTVIGLSAVIFCLRGDDPSVLIQTTPRTTKPALPFGPFDPDADRTFEIAVRAFVREQTGADLGYVEQLYTFGDRGREAPIARLLGIDDARVVSVGYLALATDALTAPGGQWLSWYQAFPWEDHRQGRPPMIDAELAPRLRRFADGASSNSARSAWWQRARDVFGLEGLAWNEERVLDRYELLYEARLVQEWASDRGEGAPTSPVGEAMASDHRRILATAISRLRAKIKYRPVIFDLMPPHFTLTELQSAAETILGLPLHKQNFRRATLASGLVHDTGRASIATGGRPAKVFSPAPEDRLSGFRLGIAAPRLKDN